MDGEENPSEPENQEYEIQDNPFRTSNMNELRTPIQPLSMQNINLNDSVIINEDRTGEDYHMVTGATKPLHNTTTTHNEHLIAEPVNIQQDPVNQIPMATEKLASRHSQPSLFHPKKHSHLMVNWKRTRNLNILKIFSTQHSECNPH